MSMILFFLLLAAIIWGIGGIVGGIITAIPLWQQRIVTTNVFKISLGWIIGFVLGGAAYYVSRIIFFEVFILVIQGPYLWGWGIIPEIPAFCVAGATIGAIGGRQMVSVLNQNEKEH